MYQALVITETYIRISVLVLVVFTLLTRSFYATSAVHTRCPS